ncbi:hypothetical protein ACFLWR_02480 [Chloroflexota bacterium]
MRIGINIPDDLLQKMEPVKKISNVSQICREAIQETINNYQRAKERAGQDGMSDIALRLRKEMESYKVNWEDLGHEDAKAWSQIATLKNFEDLMHNLENAKKKGRTPGLWVAPILTGVKGFEERAGENEAWFSRQKELDDNPDYFQMAEEGYERGWLSYVTAVWEMVKESSEFSGVEEASGEDVEP